MTVTVRVTDSPAPGGLAELAGRPVGRIGFGAMQLEHRPVGRDAALALLRHAVAAGINHIDTAQFYGTCNDLIHDALAPYPGDLVLVSKSARIGSPTARSCPRSDPGSCVPRSRPTSPRSASSSWAWSTCGAWMSGPG
jgi:aryl-alcohol dehydrogenase-like predicted oxidoreductase